MRFEARSQDTGLAVLVAVPRLFAELTSPSKRRMRPGRQFCLIGGAVECLHSPFLRESGGFLFSGSALVSQSQPTAFSAGIN